MHEPGNHCVLNSKTRRIIDLRTIREGQERLFANGLQMCMANTKGAVVCYVILFSCHNSILWIYNGLYCKHHGVRKIWILQKAVRECLFTVSFDSRTKSCKTKLPRVSFKTNGRKWFFTLHELWDSLTQCVVKGKSLHGCKIMGIHRNKYGIWNVCAIEKFIEKLF